MMKRIVCGLPCLLIQLSASSESFASSLTSLCIFFYTFGMSGNVKIFSTLPSFSFCIFFATRYSQNVYFLSHLRVFNHINRDNHDIFPTYYKMFFWKSLKVSQPLCGYLWRYPAPLSPAQPLTAQCPAAFLSAVPPPFC